MGGLALLRLTLDVLGFSWCLGPLCFSYPPDSTCSICSPAAVRDQKAPQTDAQHHPPVNVLHERDHYMWWVTLTLILLIESKCFFFQWARAKSSGDSVSL